MRILLQMAILSNKKKVLIILAVSAFSLLFLSCRDRKEKVVLNEGVPAPLFRLNDINGKIWSLEKLRGKVVLINFWAPWCPPCKDEMPSLQKLFLKTRKIQDFVILTILYKEDQHNALQYMQNNNLTLPVLIDEQLSANNMYGVTGFPETYIIDKRGILRRKIIGPTRFDTPLAFNFIAGLIKE